MLAPWTIWAAIAVFALFGLAVSWRATRENAGTAEDYYLGNRRFGGVVAGLSYAATTYSAFMLVVLTGLTYRGGIGALGFELIYFAGLGLLVIFAPRFWLAARRWGFISPAEMLGARYGSVWVARAAALVALVFLMPYCTTQMAGIGLLLSGVTGGEITLVQAVATGGLLAALWTLFAGLRSVAWTDAVQAVVMLGSALLAILFAVSAIGGWGAFAQATLETQGARLTVPAAGQPGLWGFGTFVALSLPWFFFAISNPQVSQRLFILKDMAAMRRMIFWVLGFGLAFTLVAVTWGFAALQLAPGLENTATATPALLTSGAIPAPVAVLLILGILAAAVSTLDSIALTLGAMVARDLMTDAQPRAQILTGRVVVILVILFASLFAVQKAQIVDQLAALSAAGLMVTVPAIIGAFFWRRATAAGALASILAGAALAVWMAMVQGVSVFNPVLALSVGGLSLGLFVLVSLLTRPAARALDFGADLREDLDKVGAW